MYEPLHRHHPRKKERIQIKFIYNKENDHYA